MKVCGLRRPIDGDGQRVCLGHRRLSIIDTSSAGHQPMLSHDGRLSVILNGEIYNYRELREELQSKGHQFRTQTDTEALLHAWIEWGEDCLARLNGMFAFALWDEKDAGALPCSRSRGHQAAVLRQRGYADVLVRKRRAGRPRTLSLRL